MNSSSLEDFPSPESKKADSQNRLGLAPSQVEDILDPKITKLIIEEEQISSKNLSLQEMFQIRLLHIGRSRIDHMQSYYDFSNLSRTQKLKILLRQEGALEELDIPEAMLAKIAEFIREESFLGEMRFDCISFVYQINDLPMPRQFGHFQYKDWKLEVFEDEKILVAGDTILIEQVEKQWEWDVLSGHVTHFAIYLGKGLYLSKAGNIGRLIVTDLEEMKKGFWGNVCLRARPKKKRT